MGLRLGLVSAAKVIVGSGAIVVKIVIEGIRTILVGVTYVGSPSFGRGVLRLKRKMQKERPLGEKVGN